MAIHAVIGGGALGLATARALAEKGESVRLVSRTPDREQIDGVEPIAADATRVDELAVAVQGATTVYHCANAPYHRWAQELPPLWHGILEATRRAGARLVVGTNLYALGRPADRQLDASSAFAPCSRKGSIRADLEREALAAHDGGDVPVALVRASDFYGPGVRDSVIGERFIGAAVSGKPASMYGEPDVLHSYAYLPDFGATMAAIGVTGESGDFGRSWIVPHDAPVTTRELEAKLARLVDGARVSFMGKVMLRFGALFVPAAREMIEMLYEFEEDFVVDSSETESRFGLEATPIDTGLARTVAWFRAQGS